MLRIVSLDVYAAIGGVDTNLGFLELLLAVGGLDGVELDFVFVPRGYLHRAIDVAEGDLDVG